ncbi:hypothetical protein M231_07403 [Tremella mesenterica]|uniref:Uncharacterized protein n=1 Tax=Tremella mesenterica TaxID=5217 RepID=A0A4Q1BFM6_TREME|nr:hypothetical protein M231_07403 [Tremella mesenterica]
MVRAINGLSESSGWRAIELPDLTLTCSRAAPVKQAAPPHAKQSSTESSGYSMTNRTSIKLSSTDRKKLESLQAFLWENRWTAAVLIVKYEFDLALKGLAQLAACLLSANEQCATRMGLLIVANRFSRVITSSKPSGLTTQDTQDTTLILVECADSERWGVVEDMTRMTKANRNHLLYPEIRTSDLAHDLIRSINYDIGDVNIGSDAEDVLYRYISTVTTFAAEIPIEPLLTHAQLSQLYESAGLAEFESYSQVIVMKTPMLVSNGRVEPQCDSSSVDEELAVSAPVSTTQLVMQDRFATMSQTFEPHKIDGESSRKRKRQGSGKHSPGFVLRTRSSSSSSAGSGGSRPEGGNDGGGSGDNGGESDIRYPSCGPELEDRPEKNSLGKDPASINPILAGYLSELAGDPTTARTLRQRMHQGPQSWQEVGRCSSTASWGGDDSDGDPKAMHAQLSELVKSGYWRAMVDLGVQFAWISPEQMDTLIYKDRSQGDSKSGLKVQGHSNVSQ